MKRIVAVGAGALLWMVVAAHGAWAFGVKDVVAMRRDGVDDSLIVQKIVYSGTIFHLSARDIGTLRSAGVSDEVISRMLKTEARQYGSYAHPYWGPYYYPHYRSYYMPYFYGPYYPRVSVGLRYGYSGGYRGGFRRWRR